MLKVFEKKNMSKSRKLQLTTCFSMLCQVITIVSGFILPKLILLNFGSDVNGLIVSITQFLGLISFLDFGVGQVVQSCLYAPLANRDYDKVSDIIISGKKFFRNLARIFLIYTIVLVCFYPRLDNDNFDFWYIAFLIVILSINSFSQYYFGISYQLLLNSDQRGYVQYAIQIITALLNLVCSVILIYKGFGIHTVKLLTAVIYLLRPWLMFMYVQRNYPSLDLTKSLDYEPIEQKWSGFIQHVASVVLNYTDTIVLTLFSTLEAVSVYAVYNLVISGVKQLFTSLTNGIQPILGEYWAKQELSKLNVFFGYVEWIIHTMTVFVFGCTMVLIIPFVKVYTLGIEDYNYITIGFSVVLVLAHACHCIRLPYNLMVLAGGHFRQVQKCHIIAALLNVILSCVCVRRYGLIGVAVGTLISMLYQTTWLIRYILKNLICWEIKKVVKQVVIDIMIAVFATLISTRLEIVSLNYASWLILAVKVAIIWLAVIIVVNYIFYRERLAETFIELKRKLRYKFQ